MASLTDNYFKETHKLVPIATLSGHTDRVWSIDFSPDGTLLASCGGDKNVRIWAKEYRQNSSFEESKWFCLSVLDEAQRRTVRCVKWSHCGRLLAATSFDATTAIWRRVGKEQFELAAILEGHENEVKAVAWNRADNLLATSSRDKSVWVWEALGDIGADGVNGGADDDIDNNIPADFECASVLMGHSQDVKSVVFDPNENRLVSCSYDDTIKVWEEDEDDWYCSETLIGHTSTVWSVSFEKTSKRLVSGSDDCTCIIWKKQEESGDDNEDSNLTNDRNNSKWVQDTVLKGHHDRSIYSVNWSPLNDKIASVGADDRICIYDANADKEVEIICKLEKGHASDINGVTWHPKEKNILATCGDDYVVKIWNLQKKN
eukprot:g3033.t1